MVCPWRAGLVWSFAVDTSEDLLKEAVSRGVVLTVEARSSGIQKVKLGDERARAEGTLKLCAVLQQWRSEWLRWNRRFKEVLNGVPYDVDGVVFPIDLRLNAVEPWEAQYSVFSVERCCGERAGGFRVGDGNVCG